MPKRRLTLEEIARIEDEKVAQGREAEGYVRVPGTVSRELQHVIQLTLTSAEMRQIEKRAKAKGITTGQYIREALLGESQQEG